MCIKHEPKNVGMTTDGHMNGETDRQTVGTKCEFLECSKVVPPDFTQAQKRQTNIFEEAVGL